MSKRPPSAIPFIHSSSLNSLAAQTNKDFEVIIVDDGSTKKCDRQVDKYVSSLNVRYFYKPNSGPGSPEIMEHSYHNNGFKATLLKEAFVYHKRRINLKQFFKQVYIPALPG